MKEGESLSCCVKDESRSLGFGFQKLELNHPMRHLLRAFVVSDEGKGSLKNCQVRIEEMNANEPLMRCRKGIDTVKTKLLLISSLISLHIH